LDQRADRDAGGPGGTLLLSGIIGGIVALVALALVGSGGSETGVGISSLVGVLVTLFLAYLVGGYAAGRMVSRSGAKHGLLAALLGVLVTVLVVAIGAVAGFGISDNLSGVVLPDLPEGGEQDLGSLLALSAVSRVLALLVPFIGGAMGGAWGPGRAADNRR
jgi:hypothetical protein